MQVIGGYFELADYEEGIFPHHKGILLNTGRNALEYILRSIREVKGIYVPYYTCEVVLEPLKKLHIPWIFYHINDLFEIVEEIHPDKNEYIIANNYFGIKDAYIQRLAENYGDHLIIDCAQALFFAPLSGIKSFYSTRKYVGVADGGVAYLGSHQDGHVLVNEMECTADHDKHLFIRKQFGAETGFAEYQKNETKLDNQPIRWMSDTTRMILDHIDYDKIIARRRNNFQILHEALKEKNSIQLPKLDTFSCPMVYPFMPKTESDLRKKLIENKVFAAKYWPNVHQVDDYETEYNFATKIVPIPCDQRYGKEEMETIIAIINKSR